MRANAISNIEKMKVLVIGSGGREHAIVDALTRSPQVEKIYCAPGNAGIARQAECVAVKETDVEALRDFAVAQGVGLTVVGPEVSLAAGVVDAFKAAGLRIFGPTKAAARIESSKEFAKELMAKYDIPTAGFRAFTDYAAAQEQKTLETAEREREKKVQQTMLDIKKRFGKNAILKGMNLEDGATGKARNDTIGGHKA